MHVLTSVTFVYAMQEDQSLPLSIPAIRKLGPAG